MKVQENNNIRLDEKLKFTGSFETKKDLVPSREFNILVIESNIPGFGKRLVLLALDFFKTSLSLRLYQAFFKIN